MPRLVVDFTFCAFVLAVSLSESSVTGQRFIRLRLTEVDVSWVLLYFLHFFEIFKLSLNISSKTIQKIL